MTREETLNKAKDCVCGQREQEYGTPEDNFRSIAGLWTAYMNFEFTPIDVAMMMALLKIARIRTGTATEDSFVDLAGYAACGAEISQILREADRERMELAEISQILREADLERMELAKACSFPCVAGLDLMKKYFTEK